MSEQRTIVGRCTEVSEKSGWTTFHIDSGTKYPTRLATKKPEVVEAARAVGDALATWDFGEVESDAINEHTGKPYVNRYLNAVRLGDAGSGSPAQGASTSTQAVSAPQSAAPAQTGTHPALPSGDKERSITRMACLKAAAELHQGGGKDAVLSVIEAAARFETWVMRDIDDIPFVHLDQYSAEATQTEWSDPWRRG